MAKKKAAKKAAKKAKDVDRIEELIPVIEAAETLGVSTRTIQMACHRWKMGRRVSVGRAGKILFFLNQEEVDWLNRNLQRRAGRPKEMPEIWKGSER